MEPKLEPRGTKLGPCGQQDPSKTATKTKQTNAFVPGGFGEVGSGWKWLEIARKWLEIEIWEKIETNKNKTNKHKKNTG